MTEPASTAVGLGMPQLPPPDYPADVYDRLAADAREIIGRYPDSRSALLPMLHLVQSEDGHVTATGMRFCADQLGLTPAEVTAVATFYSMYRRKASGDYQVGVCTNTLCAVLGGDAIFAALQEHLGLGHGETTEDGKVTLEHIECNAACDYAPVVMINWEFFDNQTIESAKELVDQLRAGQTVRPTRGTGALCDFKQTARVLAGFPDPRPGAHEDGGTGGAPSLVGLRLANGELPSGVAPPPGGARPTEQVPGTGRRDKPPAAAEAPATHPSSHDAPQSTAESDPHHPSGPVTASRGEAADGDGAGGDGAPAKEGE